MEAPARPSSSPPLSPRPPRPPPVHASAISDSPATATHNISQNEDFAPRAEPLRPRRRSEALQPSSRVGQLLNSRGAPSYHGSSYFGHQSAASMMQVESPELPVGMSGIHNVASRNTSRRRIPNPRFHRDEKGPYAHIWELVGYLPRRRAIVDHMVRQFLRELNPIFDSVHGETFQVNYDAFWDRKWGDDDLTAVDLRWLALLFMILAFAELLDCPLDASPDAQRSCEEASVQFFWASRKAIVLAPTLSGESPDLVRAGILVSRYLMYFGRKTESWLTSSFAIRMAQAQGMHIDGVSWGLPPKVLETRRRLWCTLYAMDRSVSLAIGRPYTTNDKHCMAMAIRNIWIDDMTTDEASRAAEQPINDPTPTIYFRYQQGLSAILGNIHDECFAIVPMTTSYHTYEKVLQLDHALLDWADSLPSYFRLERPDTSIDAQRPFIYWQRMYLHSAYHFSRVTLHRTYVLLESITDRFQYSRDACISSACADLRLKLSLRNLTMADRLKAGIAMHNLFNSALVLGIIAVKEPHSARTGAILEDLGAYCEKQRADPWVNEFVMAEVKVIELCIATARRSAASDTGAGDGSAVIAGDDLTDTRMQPPWQDQDSVFNDMEPAVSTEELGPCENWLDSWFGPTRNFPEPLDYQFWEDLVGTLDTK
ncbi:Fungal trans [Geosmithia morbida]|uniref:Fungal trans n=1 Tax=Geosmithia morbida TaxID=1094350 RepID=A0A9P4YVR6_9HYPO|nr:Fungal trans [Geosmithia morbida]KAF4121904.1 Fungal trans [Geosmithia morbida]